MKILIRTDNSRYRRRNRRPNNIHNNIKAEIILSQSKLCHKSASLLCVNQVHSSAPTRYFTHLMLSHYSILRIRIWRFLTTAFCESASGAFSLQHSANPHLAFSHNSILRIRIRCFLTTVFCESAPNLLHHFMNPLLARKPYREYDCSYSPITEHTNPNTHSADMRNANEISCK